MLCLDGLRGQIALVEERFDRKTEVLPFSSIASVLLRQGFLAGLLGIFPAWSQEVQSDPADWTVAARSTNGKVEFCTMERSGSVAPHYLFEVSDRVYRFVLSSKVFNLSAGESYSFDLDTSGVGASHYSLTNVTVVDDATLAANLTVDQLTDVTSSPSIIASTAGKVFTLPMSGGSNALILAAECWDKSGMR